MIGSGTFDELSTSGVDFSTLLKRDEEEKEQPKTYDTPHPQSPRPQDFHHHPLRQHSTISAISAHSRTRLDSASSYHSLNEKGSVMSLVSIGTEFEVIAESPFQVPMNLLITHSLKHGFGYKDGLQIFSI